jgi:hypothetical protein
VFFVYKNAFHYTKNIISPLLFCSKIKRKLRPLNVSDPNFLSLSILFRHSSVLKIEIHRIFLQKQLKTFTYHRPHFENFVVKEESIILTQAPIKLWFFLLPLSSLIQYID